MEFVELWLSLHTRHMYVCLPTAHEQMPASMPTVPAWALDKDMPVVVMDIALFHSLVELHIHAHSETNFVHEHTCVYVSSADQQKI